MMDFCLDHGFPVLANLQAEGFLGVDHAGMITFVSPDACSLLGAKPGELTGKHITSVLDVSCHKQVNSLFSGLAQNPDSPETAKLLMVRRDGTNISGIFSVCACPDGTGGIIGISTPSGPETDDRQIRAFLNGIPFSIRIFSLSGRELHSNRQTLDSVRLNDGPDPDNMEREMLGSFLLPDQLATLSKTGELVLETEHRHPDGTPFPVRAMYRFIQWQGCPAILQTVTDITREQELQKLVMKHERDMALLQLFAVDLASPGHDPSIYRFIAQFLKDFSNAVFVSISEYNPESKWLHHRHLELESGLLKGVIHLLGSRLEERPTPLSDEHYSIVTRKGWIIEKSLYEASFGDIPRPVAAALQKLLKIDRCIGITFLVDNELLGTCLMGLPAGQPDPPMELLQLLRHMAAIALRRHLVETLL